MMSPIRITDYSSAVMPLKRLGKVLGVCGLAVMLCLPAYTAMAGSWPSGCQWQRYILACFGNFHDGLARVPTGEIGQGQPTFGYIDKQGRMAIKPQFTGAADFAHGLAKVRKDDKWGYIDPDGKWVLKPQYDAASDFGTGGAAMVKKDETWHLIDRSGKSLHTFVPGTWYSAPDIQGQIDYFPVRLPPKTPVVWSVASGKAVPLPANTVGTSRGTNMPDALFVQVRGGRWGLWSNKGEWVVTPKTLGTSRAYPAPRTDGQLILMKRDDGWHLFNRQGQALGVRDYKRVKMLLPGTWSAGTGDDKQVLFGDDGKVLATFESNHPYMVKTIDPHLLAMPGKDELLLVRPHGKVERIATPGYSRIEAGAADHIWLYGEDRKVISILDQNGRVVLDARKFPGLDKINSERGLLWLYDSDSNLVALLDHDGQPVLDKDVLKQLEKYSVMSIDPGKNYAPGKGSELPLASLTDYKHHKHAVLTVSGHIVSQPEWDGFPKTYGVMPPLIVKTKQGRYGAIDGEGNWVAKPEYKRIITFHGRYTFAWLASNNHGVLLDTDGQQHEIRPSIFKQARGIRGHFVLFRTSIEGVGRRMGLWSIPKQQVVMKPTLSDVGTLSDGHFSAQTDLADGGGGAWGLIGPKGKWILPASHEDYSEPEALLPGLFVYKHKVKEHKGDDSDHSVTAYQIMSLAKGGAITPDLKKQPQLLGDDRMLIQPLDGGARLIDKRGKTLISLPGDFRDVDSKANWVTFSFGDRYGAMASDGSWKIKPTRHNLVRAKLPQGDFVVYWSDNRYASGRRAGFKDAATGKPVIGTFFSELEPMREGRAAFQRKRISGDLYGFISKDGRLVIPAAYDAVTSFNDGLALVNTPDGNVYFIDREGNRQIGIWSQCGWIATTDADGNIIWSDPKAPKHCDDDDKTDEQGSAQ